MRVICRVIFESLPLLLLISAFIIAAYYLFCRFLLKGKYSTATILISIALAFTASLGMFLFLNVLWYNSLIFFWLSVIAFVVLLVLYVIKRCKLVSVPAIITDGVFVVLMIYPFLYSFLRIFLILVNQ